MIQYKFDWNRLRKNLIFLRSRVEDKQSIAIVPNNYGGGGFGLQGSRNRIPCSKAPSPLWSAGSR